MRRQTVLVCLLGAILFLAFTVTAKQLDGRGRGNGGGHGGGHGNSNGGGHGNSNGGGHGNAHNDDDDDNGHGGGHGNSNGGGHGNGHNDDDDDNGHGGGHGNGNGGGHGNSNGGGHGNAHNDDDDDGHGGGHGNGNGGGHGGHGHGHDDDDNDSGNDESDIWYYWHNWVDSQNVSHLTRCQFTTWTAEPVADNSPPVNFFTGVAGYPATHVILRGPPGMANDWHPDPYPQFIYWMQGKGKITTMDGVFINIQAGDLYFGEDQLSPLGHLSENVGDNEIHLAAVQFRSLQPTRNQPCWLH